MKVTVIFDLTGVYNWTAVTSDYDGSPTDPVGYGSTREEALEDLVWQLTPGTVYEVDGVFYFRAACEEA